MFRKTVPKKQTQSRHGNRLSANTGIRKCFLYERLGAAVHFVSYLSHPVIYNLEYLTTTVRNLRGHNKIYGAGFLCVSD